MAPRSGLKSSPFKIVYGRPLQTFMLGTPPLDIHQETKIKQYRPYLGQMLITLHKYASSRLWHLPQQPLYRFHSGDKVLLKTWREEEPQHQQLKNGLGSPYDVLLTTHTDLKKARVMPWIHHT